MAEKKSVGHAYNIDFLNVVFAASSIFLFLCTIWMVWDDYDREWKNTQRRFTQLDMEVTRQQLAAAQRGVDKRKLTQLQAQEAAQQKTIAGNQKRVDELESQLADVSARLDRETQNYQFAKANYDSDRYAFEVRRDSGKSDAKDQQRIDEQAKGVADANLTVEKTTGEKAKVEQELGKYTGQAAEVQKQIDAMLADQKRLQTRLETIAPSLSKTLLRDAPMTDFMAPTIKVQQIMLPNVVDDVNFTKVPKLDRCTTCHLAIDKKGYEKYPQPFRTHPNLSDYLGAESPHPLNKIGCTVCHDGMGQSVDFTHAAHTPRNDKQGQEWEKKYHWERQHDWDYPMLPIGMTEASCAKCHREEVYVPNGNTLGLAYATFERAGCYACHKTRGFEGLRKPGPNLTRIKGKLKPQWVSNWLHNPRGIKPATWMPQFWFNSNNSSPADAIRNEAEIRAVVEYLFQNSEDYTSPAAPPPGDFANGRQIVETVGCLGCHVTTELDRTAAGPHRTFGQPLQGVGAKTDYEWLYNWVKDPKHYNPGTYMPNLRLTDKEAADVAAFLLTLGGMQGAPPYDQFDQKANDDVLLDYLIGAGTPVVDAKSKIASMNAHDKQIDLGQRVIGRYGCFSCHEIKGFEKAQSIGVDLSEEASKLVTRLDFAFVDIPHTKMAWFEQKLHDPRSFDKGRVLQPLEKLRMPDFHLSDQENQLLRTAILSFQRPIQPAAALPPASARHDFLKSGRAMVHRRNCVGCHTVEGDGGDFLKLVSDPSLGPPLLTPEGARVQADWLYSFLRGPIKIRPWLNVRMPTFGLDDDHLNEVIEYFQAIPNQIRPFRTLEAKQISNDTPEGKELFELLKCQKCHVLGEIPKDQPVANLAPDLRMAPERLQPEWVEQWLKAPLAIVPGTRMPMFWPNFPKSDFPQMGGDGEKQIQAIRDHVMSLRGGPSPKKPDATMSAN
jgi:mono/diheme cytochrome c family protein